MIHLKEGKEWILLTPQQVFWDYEARYTRLNYREENWAAVRILRKYLDHFYDNDRFCSHCKYKKIISEFGKNHFSIFCFPERQNEYLCVSSTVSQSVSQSVQCSGFVLPGTEHFPGILQVFFCSIDREYVGCISYTWFLLNNIL